MAQSPLAQNFNGPAQQPQDYLMPYISEREGGVERTLDPYSFIFKHDRAIIVAGQVNDDMAMAVIAQLFALNHEDPKAPINMYINSPGGSISSGFAIYSTMRHIEAPVATIGMGMCASMGSFLLAAGTPGMRSVLPDAQVMVHRPSGGSQGSSEEMNVSTYHIQDIRDRLEDYYAFFMSGGKDNLPKAETDLFHKLSDDDSYLNASMAVRLGLADQIFVPENAPDWKKAEVAMKARIDQREFDALTPDRRDVPKNLAIAKELILLREARFAEEAAAKPANQNAAPPAPKP